jgi:hypothetical protein
MYPVDAEEYEEGKDSYLSYGYDGWTGEYEHDMYAFQFYTLHDAHRQKKT